MIVFILLGAPAGEGGFSKSSLEDFYGRLTSFREGLELDLSQWPLEEEEVSRPELQWFLSQQENQETIKAGLEQLGELSQTLIQCSYQSIGS